MPNVPDFPPRTPADVPPIAPYVDGLRAIADRLGGEHCRPTLAERVGKVIGRLLGYGFIVAAGLWIVALIVLALRVLA